MISLYGFLSDLIFPSKCIGCGTPVPLNRHNVCSECLDNIDYVKECCTKCSGIITNGNCTICSDRIFYPEKNISITDYNGVIRKMLRNYKFKKNRRIKSHLSAIACRKLLCEQIDADLITFVPINKKKKARRGYNQSELISKIIAKKMNLKHIKLLEERKPVKSQKTLGYRERFLNVINRYYTVNSKSIKGKNVLIIDDIFTTGATINECARILLEAGASKVFSLTIARTGLKKA